MLKASRASGKLREERRPPSRHLFLAAVLAAHSRGGFIYFVGAVCRPGPNCGHSCQPEIRGRPTSRQLQIRPKIHASACGNPTRVCSAVQRSPLLDTPKGHPSTGVARCGSILLSRALGFVCAWACADVLLRFRGVASADVLLRLRGVPCTRHNANYYSKYA